MHFAIDLIQIMKNKLDRKKRIKRLGKFLIGLEKDHGLTNTQMAEKLGLTRQGYYQLKYSRGNQLEILLKIKQVFKMSDKKFINKLEKERCTIEKDF